MPREKMRNAKLGGEFFSVAQTGYFLNTKEMTDGLVNLMLRELNEYVNEPKYSYEEMLSAFNLAVSVVVAQLSAEEKDYEMELEKFAHIMKENSKILRKKIHTKEKLTK